MLDSAKQRLVFALDVPDAAWARQLVGAVGGEVGCFKVGLELFVAEGPALVRSVVECGPVFLDLKLHDIPATVGRAAAAAERLGVTYLTAHAQDEASLSAAVKAAPEVGILGVTVLTSVAPEELARQTGGREVIDVVVERARLAQAAGCKGVVCSGKEARAVREAIPAETGFLIVTPGVRPTGQAAGDQKRVVTPAGAISAGADLIVVGRPIRDAADPAIAARAITDEIAAALA